MEISTREETKVRWFLALFFFSFFFASPLASSSALNNIFFLVAPTFHIYRDHEIPKKHLMSAKRRQLRTKLSRTTPVKVKPSSARLFLPVFPALSS
jgi:hypothetical protein